MLDDSIQEATPLAMIMTTTTPDQRKPRLLWATPYCLLDTASGAALAVRQMLIQLIAQGYEVQVLGATVFDHERGAIRLKADWAAIQEELARVIKVEDPPCCIIYLLRPLPSVTR